MDKEIIWSKKARQTFLDISIYLQDKWGTDKAIVFSDHVNYIIELIQKFPNSYPKSVDPDFVNIRKCVINKQTSLYYRVEENSIVLITFFDNRRSPDNLSLG